MEGIVQWSEGSWGSSPLQFLLISFLIASSPSKLSQHFHVLCDFYVHRCWLCLPPLGAQLTAKERVKDAGLESSAGTTPHKLRTDRREDCWGRRPGRFLPGDTHPPRSRGEWGAGRGTEKLRALLGRAIPACHRTDLPSWWLQAWKASKSVIVLQHPHKTTLLVMKWLTHFFPAET